MQGVKRLLSLNPVRTLGWLSIILVAGLFAWTLIEDRLEKAALQREIADLRQRIARLTSETPRARVLVESVEPDAQGRRVTQLVWVETDAAGRLLPGSRPLPLQLLGNDVHFDTRQIIFSSADIAAGDPLRGCTLTLFSRAWGEHQAPEQGVSLEQAVVPAHYASRDAGLRDAEETLWRNFREYCSDPAAAERDHVRTAQGTAVHKPLIAGREYRISVTAPGQILLEGPFEPDPFVFRPQR